MDSFEIIIAPFIYIIKQVFFYSLKLAGNYGVAIVLLSLIISLLLLPVFILIERAKKKDDALRLKMKPFVDEIKRCYKGQERYYYIKTLHRQHDYSTVRSLIPILSLLLQIPFFIAAYKYLESYSQLEGVKFLFIQDLAVPDGLLGVVNILPVLMTIINLTTAYFYTRKGNVSERWQMLLVAGIFLVLLFNLPSGLVLYWTMNNVFSFLRLFITNPEVFQKTKNHISSPKMAVSGSLVAVKTRFLKLRSVFLLISIIGIISQINWALQHEFSDIYIRIIASIIGSGFLVLLYALLAPVLQRLKIAFENIEVSLSLYYFSLIGVIYFAIAANYYFTGTNAILNSFAVIILIPLQLMSFRIFVGEKHKTSTYRYNIALFVLVLVALFQLLSGIAFISDKEVSIVMLNTSIVIYKDGLSFFILYGIIFSLISTLFIWKKRVLNISENKIDKHWIIFLITILYFSGLIFFWHPLIVYSSSPESFSFPAFSIIKKNVVPFIVLLFALIGIYLVSKNRLKQIILILVVSIAFSAFINVFIMPVQMGTLQMNRFSNINSLSFSIIEFVFELIVIISIFWLVNYLLKKKKTKPIIWALVLLNIVAISQAVFLSKSSNSLVRKRSKTVNSAQEDFTVSSRQTISFSKNKENVVIIMADMFQGWYINKIMQEDNSLAEQFDGFVWYSNTVSVSNYTAGTMPAILAGFDFIPSELDKDSLHTLAEKTLVANEIFRNKIKDKGYHFTSTKVPYSSMDKNTIDTYLPLWHKDWDYLKNTLNIGNSREFNYTVLWQNALFFCSPKFIKSKIYNNGSWLIGEEKVKKDVKIGRHYNFMRALPFISDADNKKANFTLICTKASHFPWDIVDDNGVIHQNITPFENNKWTLEKIAAWIAWMKDNDVYDNTKIILVSDHGIRDTEVDETVMVENPFIPKMSEEVPLKHLLYYTPLLMVKDYNSKGKIKEDTRFMSNADVPYIAFDENDPTKNAPRVSFSFDAFLISWRIEVYKNIYYPIDKTYTIKDNVYNISNWETK